MFLLFRILFTVLFSAAFLYAIRFFPPGILAFQAGSVTVIQLAAGAALVFIMWLLPAGLLCHILRGFRFRFFTLRSIKARIRSRQRSLLNWLLSRPAHWGITGTASEPQYANTCEGLLALHSAGYFEKKKESCRSAVQTLTQAVMPTGLPSRTVGRPTVINTSMLLSLITMEKRSSSGVIEDFGLYDDMAANLWFLRSDDGWGPLILKADKKECRLVNTWWALRALYQYGYLEQPEEGEAFRQLLLSIYEKNRDGTFGFTASDAPRLTVTAMYLLLYYELPRSVRRMIDQDYDPAWAAEFIYDRFVKEKCQVEVESIDGTFAGGTYIAHTPWKHIASAYAMQALAAARKNGILSSRRMADVYRRTAEILTQDLRSPAVGESYYLPSDIEVSRTGPYTFAAAHLIQGLQALLQ